MIVMHGQAGLDGSFHDDGNGVGAEDGAGERLGEHGASVWSRLSRDARAL